MTKPTSILLVALLLAVSLAAVKPVAALAGVNTANGHITGIVWQDSNGNGIREPEELPLAHHEVYLQRVGVEVSGTMAALVFTDAEGVFTFDNLEEGQYRLYPEGGEFTLVEVVGVDATANVDLPVPVQYTHQIFLPISVR